MWWTKFLEAELKDWRVCCLSELLQAGDTHPETHPGLASVATEVRTSLGYPLRVFITLKPPGAVYIHHKSCRAPQVRLPWESSHPVCHNWPNFRLTMKKKKKEKKKESVARYIASAKYFDFSVCHPRVYGCPDLIMP